MGPGPGLASPIDPTPAMLAPTPRTTVTVFLASPGIALGERWTRLVRSLRRRVSSASLT